MPFPLRRMVPQESVARPTCERWVRHEGLVVAAIVLGLVLVAWIEQIVLPYVRQ